ncbi:hypothetical protein DFH07DRAFT_823535 [Mycena maculata]|uniref:Uncharacterized protein n=1 Tax=Mycena maculata TaxID=230809 RepID=A0AAD7IZJ5_9AGAR|nr:hypothetical protein DFH07DRAFT_823535 [Mycena maculata]
MPFFGSSNKHENKLEKRNPGAATTELQNTQRVLVPLAKAWIAMELPVEQVPPALGLLWAASPLGNLNVVDRRHHAGGMQAAMANDAMRNGPGDPQYGAGGAGASIPPVGAINEQPHRSCGAASKTGKIEQAVGSLVGSNTLEAKGLQKEQCARASNWGFSFSTCLFVGKPKVRRYRVLSSGKRSGWSVRRVLRRERAVAHGAYPDNRRPGAGGGPVL